MNVARTDLLARANDLRASRTPFVFATVVRVERPTSAKAGDCALVLPDGTIEGFVGGDCAESTVRLQGLRQLAAGQSALLRITPGGAAPPAGASAEPYTEGVVTVANPCLSGGTLDIFLDVMRPPVLVHVFGDTPIARALAALGEAMGWDMRAAVKPDVVIPPDAVAVVVASHGGDEESVLTQALRGGVPYVGLVASRRRGGAVIESLGAEPEQRARLRSPAGLDIGARGPGEIAASILAEIIASRPAAGAAGRAPSAPGPAGAAEAHGAARPGGAGGRPDAGSPGALAGPPQAVDPVCGMTVAATMAAAASPQYRLADTTWYFCGPGCRDVFAADPGRYTA
jgi:xanthine dehydrogenase accessory factor